MDRQRQRRDMFMVPVVQQMFETSEMEIPYAFLARHGAVLSRKINLCFPNGDIFECQFCKKRNCLYGMLKIYAKFKIESSSVVMFEKVTDADFMVTVIGPTAVEVKYPADTKFTPYKAEKPISATVDKEGNILTQFQIAVYNPALVDYNARRGPEQTIELCIKGKDILIEDTLVAEMQKNREKNWLWRNGWCLYFSVGEKAWEVEIRRIGKICQLGKGWEVVARDLDLHDGDNVTLVENGNPYHFKIFVYRGLVSLTKCIEMGQYTPTEFIRLVNQRFLSTGVLFLPKLIWYGAWVEIDDTVNLVVTGKGIFKSSHNSTTHSLEELGPFIQHNHLEEDNMLLFRIVAPNVFSVNIFDRSDVSMSAVV